MTRDIATREKTIASAASEPGSGGGQLLLQSPFLSSGQVDHSPQRQGSPTGRTLSEGAMVLIEVGQKWY
jgi:hypothetical protein